MRRILGDLSRDRLKELCRALSDRFEEEAQKLIADGMSETVAWTDPDEHQFFVPDRARWGRIQRTATNIGEALNKACAALEEQNSALEGVLAGIDYNDERKFGDARNRDTVLARLVQHFSEVSLRNDRMAEPDLLGRAYEYLIEQFADDAGKKGGEFYTPRMVVKLIVELLAPTERMRICDPTAGSGGMLIECAHHIERKDGNPRNLTLSRVAAFVGDAPIVAHNAHFDRRFLEHNARLMGMTFSGNEWVCTMRMPQRVPVGGRYKLGALAERLDVPDQGGHRALDDWRSTIGVYRAVRRQRQPRAVGTTGRRPGTGGGRARRGPERSGVRLHGIPRRGVGGQNRKRRRNRRRRDLQEGYDAARGDADDKQTGKVKKAREYGIDPQQREFREQEFYIAQ